MENKVLKMGVIGLGQRGYGLIETMLAIDTIEIVAVCDEYDDRVERAINKIDEVKHYKPVGYKDYKEVLNDKNVDAVLIATSWETHIHIAIESMKIGKITAMEVGGAYSLKDCYELVKTYEKYKTPFMMLENCCYDRFELLTTKLVRDGLLGEVIHAHGAYSHDLRDEITGGNVNRHYRLRNYIARNAENYPTHELGPIAKVLNITRGNRLVSMTSVASKARGLELFTKDERCVDKSLTNQKFNQGDIISTIIKCENGETITLTLDTTLPKYYSREFTIRGTSGLAVQESNMVMLDTPKMHDYFEPHKTIEHCLNNAEEYKDKLPEYWKNITEEQMKTGHGGMDYFMLVEFANCALNNLEMPIDVYDAATWYAITPLSEISIKHNGKVVKIPDFTKGKYKERKAKDVIDMNY